MAKELNKNNFKNEVLDSNTPVLVDFWAPWCSPCRMLTPVIEGLAEEFGEKINIAKVNVDNERELAAEYGIMSIPNVMIFHKGKVVENLVGYRGEADYRTKLQKYL